MLDISNKLHLGWEYKWALSYCSACAGCRYVECHFFIVILRIAILCQVGQSSCKRQCTQHSIKLYNSKTTLSIRTQSILNQHNKYQYRESLYWVIILSVTFSYCYSECCYAERHTFLLLRLCWVSLCSVSLFSLLFWVPLYCVTLSYFYSESRCA